MYLCFNRQTYFFRMKDSLKHDHQQLMSPFLVNKQYHSKKRDQSLSLSPFLVSQYDKMSLEEMKTLMDFFNNRSKASGENTKPNKVNRRYLIQSSTYRVAIN